MTNELEKQFFDTFGIEPKIDYLCPKCNVPMYKVWRSDGCGYTCAHETHTDYELKHESEMKDYEKAYRYPQITDRILLGIIAKIMWSYSCTQNDFDAYEVHTVDNLKEAVLKHAIELSKNDAYVYWGVRTLFEEG